MKKRMIRGLVIGLSYYLVWFLIDHIIPLIASDSPSRKAYGILSAWWAVLYFCSYVNITIKDIWYLTVPGILYAAYLASGRHDSHYTLIDNINLFVFSLTPFFMNLLLMVLKKLFQRNK